MRRRSALLVALALTLASPAKAGEVVSERPDAVKLTVYNDPYGGRGSLYDGWYDRDDGLALVIETRTVDLPAGRSVVRFRAVADAIVPESARLVDLDGRVVERNFDYDVVTPGALIRSAVGGPVTLVRTNPKGVETAFRGVLRSGPDGVVVETADGFEPLRCGGLTERLVFDALPPGLVPTPTLSAIVDAPQAGPQTLTLAYLATGVLWRADYVLTLSPDGRTADLLGWLTIGNFGDTTFADTPAEVIAGEIDWYREEGLPDPELRSDACWPPMSDPPPKLQMREPAAAEFDQGPMPAPPHEEIVVTGSRISPVNLGDMKLYRAPGRTAFAPRQIKQIGFISTTGVPVTAVHQIALRGSDASDPDALREVDKGIRLEIDNAADGPLALPLPGGRYQLFAADPLTGPTLLGEANSTNRAVGETLRLNIEMDGGVAVRRFDLISEREFVRRGVEITRRAYEVELANERSAVAEVELDHDVDEVLVAVRTRSAHEIHGDFLRFRLRLNPGERRTVRYETETRPWR